jgi:hypothetical protein
LQEARWKFSISVFSEKGFSSLYPVVTLNHPVIMKVDTPEFKALFSPELKTLVSLFKDYGYELRIAGGAVRLGVMYSCAFSYEEGFFMCCNIIVICCLEQRLAYENSTKRPGFCNNSDSRSDERNVRCARYPHDKHKGREAWYHHSKDK